MTNFSLKKIREKEDASIIGIESEPQKASNAHHIMVLNGPGHSMGKTLFKLL